MHIALTDGQCTGQQHIIDLRTGFAYLPSFHALILMSKLFPSLDIARTPYLYFMRSLEIVDCGHGTSNLDLASGPSISAHPHLPNWCNTMVLLPAQTPHPPHIPMAYRTSKSSIILPLHRGIPTSLLLSTPHPPALAQRALLSSTEARRTQVV